MLNETAQEVLEILLKKTKKSEKEIKQMISDKLEEFNGLISIDGAAHIVAKELGHTIMIKEQKKVSDPKCESNDHCTECDEEVKNQKTIEFSQRKYGKLLCWNCQQGKNAPKAKTPTQQEFGNGNLNEIQIAMLHKDTIVMLAASATNPFDTEFEKTYDKTFNILMKEFRKKLKELS